jgi:hypothetical protein
MSRNRQKRKQAKHQKAKLFLIPLLLAVLGYLLLSGTGSEEDAAPITASKTPGSNEPTAAHSETMNGTAPANTQPPAVRRLVSTSAGPAVNSQALTAWPRADLSQLGKVSPFASTVITTPEPPAEESDPTEELANNGTAEIDALPPAPVLDLDQLSQQPVHYYFQSRKRRVMLLGEHLLSEGQSLENYTVKQLEPTRVQLESILDVTLQQSAQQQPAQQQPVQN